MKNDTQIAPRLESILTILATGPHSRLILEQKTGISRITLIRDLTKLIGLGKVETIGSGRSTQYLLANFNPLLSTAKPRHLTREIHFNPSVLDHLHHLLTPLEERSASMRSLSTAKDTLGTFVTQKEIERWTIDFAWKSSAIEGNTYTLPETATLLSAGRYAKNKTTGEAQMILNHKTAVEYIFNHPPRASNLTLKYILHIHTLLSHNLPIPLGLRKHAVGISGSIYLPPANPQIISLALEKTVSCINNAKHPVEKFIIAVALLSYIQPFMDGNKRTARLIGNALLLSHDLIPVSYRTLDERTYLDALLLFYEQNSLVAFKNLLLDQLTFSHSHYFRITDSIVT